MKHHALYISAIIMALTHTNVFSQELSVHTNTIIGQNIKTVTHNINNNIFNTISQPRFYRPNPQQKTPVDMYGSMPIYGEYNNTISGHNGGDTTNNAQNWIFWQNTNNKTSFNNSTTIDNQSNTLIAGFAGATTKINNIENTFGLYTGYTGGAQENKYIDIDEHGGIFGIFNSTNINNTNIIATINAGIMDSDTKSINGTDKTTNTWIDGAAKITHNIFLNNNTILRPGLYTEYLWIKSDNYTSCSGAIINNENLHKFEITPELSLITHITDNWTTSINAKYIIHLDNSSSTTVDTIKIKQLDTGNYFEYGLSITKSIQNFNFGAYINRQDGETYGWSGGLNFKYTF